MQQPKEIQQELKRMREISDNIIIISDLSHTSTKKKKNPEIINISDASHSSKKDKKLLDHQNKKNIQTQKEILITSTEKVKELTVPVKSQNWLAFKAKNKENDSKKKQNKLKYSENMHVSLYPLSTTFKGDTPIVAVDCEMVLSKENYAAQAKHELGRVCIVNYNGHILYDEFVRPKYHITNYLTWVSGISYQKIKDCETFDHHKDKVFALLKGKIVVGHTLKSDFDALNFDPQLAKYRDLKIYKFLQEDGKVLSLKRMCEKFLKIDIQNGEHSPVEDARAAMMIYKKFEKRIEVETKHRNFEEIKRPINFNNK